MGEGIAAEILVVDDERAVRRGVAAILEGAGYVVREAKNGKEALRFFGESMKKITQLFLPWFLNFSSKVLVIRGYTEPM